MTIEDERLKAKNLTGVSCGLYQVRISRQVGGKEMIPEEYNAKTTLGVEISPDAEWVKTGLGFDL